MASRVPIKRAKVSVSWCISSAVVLVGAVDVTGATVSGLATSRIRSAMSASCDNERWSDEEASTYHTH